MDPAPERERPICFIGDIREPYARSLPRLQQTFQALFHEDVEEPEMAAALSSVMVLAPKYLGTETFHRIAGSGPIDRLLVIGGASSPSWSTNQLNHPFSPRELFQAVQQTFEGQLECRLTDLPSLNAAPNLDPESNHLGDSFEIGDRVVSRSTPSLGEGVVTGVSPLMISVQFANAPGKLANHPIRCHISVLRRSNVAR